MRMNCQFDSPSLSSSAAYVYPPILLYMRWLFVIALLIWAASSCYTTCAQCFNNNDPSPYSCRDCNSGSSAFIWSCQAAPSTQAAYIVLSVSVTVLYMFMLVMGQGVYRDLFQGVQLCSLLTWRYDFQTATDPLQGTNFGIMAKNSFPDSFGSQFICVMIFLGLFWLLLVLVDSIPHSPTATLIRRKKIIFPARIFTICFNMLLFSSVVQLATVSPSQGMDYFAIILAALALVKIFIVLFGLAVASNWKHFEPSDPNYYVLVEQLSSTRWYVKNNLLFNLLTKMVCILGFILSFSRPTVAGAIMVSTQGIYSIYVIALLRFKKIRYYVINVAGNLLVLGILASSFIGANNPILSQNWLNAQLGYLVLILTLSFLLVISLTVEIVLLKEQIFKQMKSILYRFILCVKTEDKVATTKFDKDAHRERVTDFKANLIYEGGVELKTHRDNSF